MQNLAKCKKPFILHILTKKNTHISGCKIVYKCISAIVTVHICTVTVALTFNILVIFPLSLSLVALTLTPLSLFLIWSNHQTTVTNQIIKPPPLIATDTNLSLIAWSNHQTIMKLDQIADRHCHEAFPITNRHWFLVVWSMGFMLGEWWFGFQIEWVGFP